MRQGLQAGNNTVTKQDSNLKYTITAYNYYGTITANITPITYPVFLPDTYAYNFIGISDSYTVSKELKTAGNPYQFINKIDTHQMKDSEWGAVAYLAHSKYGRNGEEVTINNVYGGRNQTYGITGYAGASISASQILGTGSSYAWNTTNGYKASTTNNPYGIYDLIGSLAEYTAGYLNNGKTYLHNSNLYNDGGSQKSTEYKTVWKIGNLDGTTENYNANSNRKGEAIWETSTNGGNSPNGWLNDSCGFAYTNCLVLVRGGNSTYHKYSGLFNFNSEYITSNQTNGFRAVLICE